MKPLFKVITIISILSIGAFSVNQYKDYDLYLVKDNSINNIQEMNTASNVNRNDIQFVSNINQDLCTKPFENMENIKVIQTTGSSMRPTTSTGNKVICDSSINDYKEGMVISFNNGNTKTMHRIKALYIDNLITQGDYNSKQDERINYSQIECVVIGVCY